MVLEAAFVTPLLWRGCLLVAEVLACLATDTTVYLSRRGEALKVNTLDFHHPRFRFLMTPWAPWALAVS